MFHVDDLRDWASSMDFHAMDERASQKAEGSQREGVGAGRGEADQD
jgi:hypothetical protein